MGDWGVIVTSMYMEQALLLPQNTVYFAELSTELLPCSLCRVKELSKPRGLSHVPHPQWRPENAYELPLGRTPSIILSPSLSSSQGDRYLTSNLQALQAARTRRYRLERREARAVRTPRPRHPQNQALSCCLPLVFRLCSILRPVLVRMRLRNPCLRMRISRDGRFMFMYRRGPHRICEPTPASAGCAVIAARGTTSAASDPPAAAIDVVAVVVGVKALVLGARRPAAGLRAKMLGCAEMPGRRTGRDEKDLFARRGLSVGDSWLGQSSTGGLERTSSGLVVSRHLGLLRGARTGRRAAT